MDKKAYFIEPKKRSPYSIEVTEEVRDALNKLHEKDKKKSYIKGTIMGGGFGLLAAHDYLPTAKANHAIKYLRNGAPPFNKNRLLITGVVVGAGAGAGGTAILRKGQQKNIEKAESITPNLNPFLNKEKQFNKLKKEIEKNSSAGHEMIWYEKRSTPEVIPVGDKPKAKPSYGPITKRRKATADEEKEIATGKWIRIDQHGNRPSSPNYKKTAYRPQLLKEKLAFLWKKDKKKEKLKPEII